MNNEPSKPIRLQTIHDIANRLQLSTKTVRRMIKSGDLIGHLIGSQWRVSEDDLQLYLRTRRGANLAEHGVQR